MSVIFGVCGSAYAGKEIDAMHRRLRHWEPDASYTWAGTLCALGHLALFNTPLSVGQAQPLRHHDLVITADVRLDNRADILRLLKLPATASLPDAMLILMLYELYGSGCCRYLIGDFAFAIIEVLTGKLFCARDHLGVKPFFYRYQQGVLAFASEMKGLLNEAPEPVDDLYLITLLTNRQPEHEQTFYRYIFRLPPAHTLTLINNELRIELYWDLDINTTIHLADPEEYYGTFRELLNEAVRCRSISAYPVGSQLSGGLDSSVITLLADKHLCEKKLHTFSFTVADADKQAYGLRDERSLIDLLTARCHNLEKHFITDPGINNVFDELDRELFVDDGLEMMGSGWQEPMRRAAAANGVRTLLSGYPGDEAVSNSGSQIAVSYLDRNRYDLFMPHLLKSGNAAKWFKHLFPQLWRKIRHTPAWRTSLLKRIAADYPFMAVNAYPALAMPAPSDLDEYRSYRHYLKHRLLQTSILRMEEETRYGIAHKIEPRFPLADIRLISFFIQMPDKLKYHPKLNRYFFRKATEGLLPDEIRLNTDKSIPTLAYLPLHHYKNRIDMYHWFKQFVQQYPEARFPNIRIPELETGTIPPVSDMPIELQNIPLRKIVKLARFVQTSPGHSVHKIFK